MPKYKRDDKILIHCDKDGCKSIAGYDEEKPLKRENLRDELLKRGWNLFTSGEDKYYFCSTNCYVKSDC